jgi:uncharacterized protein
VILLDTTCLVYAVGDDHERQASARALMDAALRGTITARTTSQVIMEFAHVRGRRRDRRDAASLARDFSDLLGPLEPTTAPDVSTALTLWQDNPEIGSFDALLLAVAVRIGAEAVVSEDAGLARVGIVPVMSAAEAVRAWA